MSFEKPRSIIHIRIRPRKTSHSDINDKSTYKSKQRCASQSFTQLSKTNTAFNHSISSSGILKKLDVWSDKNSLTIDHHRNIEKNNRYSKQCIIISIIVSILSIIIITAVLLALLIKPRRIVSGKSKTKYM